MHNFPAYLVFPKLLVLDTSLLNSLLPKMSIMEIIWTVQN